MRKEGCPFLVTTARIRPQTSDTRTEKEGRQGHGSAHEDTESAGERKTGRRLDTNEEGKMSISVITDRMTPQISDTQTDGGVQTNTQRHRDPGYKEMYHTLIK